MKENLKDLIMIGTGSFAKLLSYYVTEYGGRRIAAFSVDSAYINENRTFVLGVNVYPLESVEKTFPPDRFEVILGVGYSKMNQVRKDLFSRCKQKGYTIASFIHPTAVVSKDAKMGEGNILLEQVIVKKTGPGLSQAKIATKYGFSKVCAPQEYGSLRA